MGKENTDADAIAAFIAAKGKKIAAPGVSGCPLVVTALVISCGKGIPYDASRRGAYFIVRHLSPKQEDVPETYGIAGREEHLEGITPGMVVCFPIKIFLMGSRGEATTNAPENFIKYRIRKDKRPFLPRSDHTPPDQKSGPA
jgi:hypothetical protein